MPDGLTSRFVTYLRRKKGAPVVSRIHTDDGGIRVDLQADRVSRIPATIPWPDISNITVFKRSVYAHDVVCMIVQSRRRGELQVDETVPGWQQLIEEVPRRLPAATPFEQWFPVTAFEDRESRPTVIYSDTPQQFDTPGR